MSDAYRAFYDRVEWSELTDREQDRVNRTVGCVPRDVKTVLEIGCGDGRIASPLATRADVTVVEYSLSTLRRCPSQGLKRVQATGPCLPFADHSFDLVLCCEVLEHLPESMFQSTLEEMRRTSRRYVVVSVPLNENLLEEAALCPWCGELSHRYGHVRSFDRSRFVALLPGFSLAFVSTFGPSSTWIKWMIKLRGATEGGMTCLKCGTTSQSKPSSSKQRTLDRIHANLIRRWHKQPYWIIGLFEKS